MYQADLVVIDDDFHTQTLLFQRKLLEKTLEQNHWNVSKTARDLNLSRSHIHNLMKRFDLERKGH